MPLPRLRWIILVLLCLSTAINYIDRQALSVLLPTLRGDLHLTSASYGTIATLFLVAYTASQLLLGPLIDRIGTRKGFSLSIIIWSLAAIAHAFVRGFASLAIVRLALGIGEAGNWPAGGKAVAQWFPREQRAFAMGMFDGGSAIGAVIAPPLVAVLTIYGGWRLAFVVTGLLGLIWLALWLWIYESPERHRWLSVEDRAQAMQEPAHSAGPTLNFLSIIRSRQLLGLMATRMTATPVWWFYVFWLPDYLSKGRGFTLAEIGLFGWIPFFTVDLGKLAGGASSDWLLKKGWSASRARKSVMVVGAFAMAAGLCVANARTSVEALGWVSLATFGFGMWSANILALHADIFPPGKMGTALGLTGTAASLGGALATYEIGQIVDRWGYHPVFLFTGLAPFVACFALIFWIGKVKAL